MNFKIFSQKKTKKLIYNILVGCLIIGGVAWVCSHFVHLGKVEFTDNAQVKQLIVPVNCRVQGFVSKIFFDEYQNVKKGDTLALIEDSEFRLRVAQAEADYQNALSGKSAMHTGIQTTKNNISVSDAAIDEARVTMQNAQTDYERYKTLWESNNISRQQHDNAKTACETARARYEQLVRQKQSTSLLAKEQTQRLDQQTANIKLAEAALDLARLNLSYTVILAPCDGTTGRKNIQAGQLVQPGQAIVDMVAAEKWIVANYKERQTANIREGQEVEIEADAVPNVQFRGVVKSLSRATGASFSLLPQDNSAGNFVKVQQRIPVRIEFTADNKPEDLQRLRAGMNVECEVKY
ncbi:MAG: HlyD family secretion protein [Prevotellaceae bacterium]|jgi:membrane fusion protein (multidrug efflux system)|nr:HlyD family secretion protein [Prevotellaceae bacterium]